MLDFKGVTVDVAGAAADMTETLTQLGLAMLAAIGLLFFILNIIGASTKK